MAKVNAAVLAAKTPDGPDPGEFDNRLSLDPNSPGWKDKIAEWEDGQEYDIKLKVRQISPGEYEVVEMNAEAETETEEVAPKEEAEPMIPKGKVNPSVRRMAYEGA